MEGILTLFTMPGYQEKSDIWLLPNGHADFLYSNIHEIKSFAEKHYPETATTPKTAIVIETELQRELANEYARLGEDLPSKITLFPNLNSAEEWITK